MLLFSRPETLENQKPPENHQKSGLIRAQFKLNLQNPRSAKSAEEDHSLWDLVLGELQLYLFWIL